MSSRPASQPPFSVDLLADLHAGNLPPDVSADLWPRVRQDPDAVAVLAALDAVRDRLRTLGANTCVETPIPPHVAARIEQSLAAEPIPLPSARTGRFGRNVGRIATRPVTLAAAVAVLAAATAAVMIGLTSEDRSGTPSAQPSSPTGPAGDTVLSADAMLAALHHEEVSGPLGHPDTMTACLRAVGAPSTVLGSMDIHFRGRDAVLVVVPSATSGKVTALVVTPRCGPTDTEVLARADF